MAEKLDAEDVREIVRRAFELITIEIHRFEGTIFQYSGDGMMALFGAPLANEDGSRRAVHAALGIQRALSDYGQELEQQRGLKLQMRMGLNSGLVVVGKIGDDLHMEYTAIGDTINLASRLQNAARPGSILVSEATHKQVAGYFETLDLGELEVKGHAPVRAFEVMRARARRARLDVAVERGLTPLIGRERELAVLDDLFRLVEAGHGQVVFIAGEAGIGKSRLLLEFHRRLDAAGEKLTWLEGRCVSFGQAIPMLPVIEQLRDNFGIEEIDGEPEIIAKVEQGMRRLGGLESETPYVRYLLSVDSGESVIGAMNAAERRTRLLNALRAMTLQGANRRTLVLVIEDLHWIDTSTKEYLDYFIDSVGGARVMLILTHRLNFASPFGSRSFHTTLNLRHLSEAETLEMARKVLGTDRFPEALIGTIRQKAEGVPLFVEEVTKTLVDLGFLVRKNGAYQSAGALEDVAVPGSMQDIIMARLDRLGEDGKRTVQLASVIGRQFIARLLERIAGLSGKLEGLLRELKALEIIYEQGMIPEPAYIFKHAVIQDVAYNSLLLQRRRELHSAVGEAIAELYTARLSEHYGELAHHFTRAEDWPRSMHYSALAGDQAAYAFANVEAKRHYLTAIEAAGKLKPPPDTESRIGLHSRYGAVLLVLGEYDEAAAQYSKSLELARSTGDRRREMEALVWLSSVYDYSHHGEPAIEYSEQALAIARELDDREFQAICLANRVATRTAGYGQIVETMADAEEALRLSKEIKNQPLLAKSLVFVGGAFQWRGDFDRSLGYLHEGAELARKIHAGFLYGFAVFQIGHVTLSKGDYEEALRWYTQLDEYASAAGDKFWIARVPNLIGAVHLELYDLDTAVERNLEANEIAKREWQWPEPRGHSLLKVGLAHLEKDEHAKAEHYLQSAWDLLEKDTWYRWRWHIPLLRARGALALKERRFEEAWKYAIASLEMATACDSRKHIARAQLLQGEILAATARLDEAARILNASVALAHQINVPQDAWLGGVALGKVLLKLGQDKDAEAQFVGAAHTIEAIAQKLTTPALRHSFLTAIPVLEVYRLLGQPPPRF